MDATSRTYRERGAERLADTLAKVRHYDWDDGEPETSLQDLLSDAIHFADVYGLDFDPIMDQARRIYWSERHDDVTGNPPLT